MYIYSKISVLFILINRFEAFQSNIFQVKAFVSFRNVSVLESPCYPVAHAMTSSVYDCVTLCDVTTDCLGVFVRETDIRRVECVLSPVLWRSGAAFQPGDFAFMYLVRTSYMYMHV